MLTHSLISNQYDPDVFQELEVSSPVGLPESLNISSDLEIVLSSEDSDSPQPREEPLSTDEAKPVKDPFGWKEPTDDWSHWRFGSNAAASSSPPQEIPIYEEEAPVLTSTSIKGKKSKKVKRPIPEIH